MTALITVDELASSLDDVSVLHVPWSLAGPSAQTLYDEGHVPGACLVDLDTDLADPPGERGRHPLPDVGRFEAAMRRVGVSNGRPVVVYDQGDGTIAARAWWLLRHHGHDDVRVLDGGLAAWAAAGRPLSTEPSACAPGDFTARPGRLAVVDAEGAQRLAREGLLLDSRAGERYRGEVEPVDPVAGHIPGAVSAPTRDNADGAGHFLPVAALAERFSALGVRGGGPVGAYCGSGVTAAHQVLALHLAGIEAVLYPGSWSEWVADPSRPVATGADRG